MKKGFGVFIFLILVLSLSIVSAVWWNPATWFKKNVQLSPDPFIFCSEHSSAQLNSVPCNPATFTQRCLNSIDTWSDGCGDYFPISPKERKIFYPISCQKILEEVDIFCEVVNYAHWDCDDDGYTEDANVCSSADCDDNDPTIFPGSGVCTGDSCKKCDLNGEFVNDPSCNLPNDGDCKMCTLDGLIDDNTDSSIGSCYKCVSGVPTYDENINPTDDGDCKKCSTSGLIPDNTDSAISVCDKCISGTLTHDDTLNPIDDGDCKKCSSGSLGPDLTDNSINPDCQQCISANNGEVLNLNSDPVVKDCWTCSSGTKTLKMDFRNNDGDCKTCDSSLMIVAPDNSDSAISVCDKCISGTLTHDDTLNPIDDGDCKKCSSGSLGPDLTDNSINPDCQKCVSTNGGEVLNLNEDVTPGDCWTCSSGTKVVDDSDFPPNDGDCKKCDPTTFTIINDDADKPKPYHFTSPTFDWLQGAPMGCVKCLNQLPNFDATLNPPNDGDCKKCDAASLMMLSDNLDSLLIGTCKKCELSNAVDIPDGGGCNGLTSLSGCCGGSCYTYSSTLQQAKALCCGGYHYAFFTLVEKRRHTCCDGNLISLRSTDNCGTCGKKCSGSTPYCHMNPGFFEDCYKCAECLTSSNCPSGETCVWWAKKCALVWPPSIGGIFTTTVIAPSSSPADAIQILKSKLGYSSNVICSGGGIETITVNIISAVLSSIGAPGSGFVFTITYTITTSITPGSGGGSP